MNAEHGVGGGHIPERGPAPVHTPPPKSPAHSQRRTYSDQQGHPEAPHVHAENDHWTGPRGETMYSA